MGSEIISFRGIPKAIFIFFRSAPSAYGGSQASSQIRTTAPSCVYDLHHSSQQHSILNPLSEARDQTHDLIVPSQIHFYCATMGTPKAILFLNCE